jgi:phosphoribosylaminoimidazole carboxylase PurE protein
MGSDSDLPTMKAAAELLDDFGVPYEITIVSAHRTPDRMYSYAREAAGRGIKVLIAGAGGAAHLPVSRLFSSIPSQIHLARNARSDPKTI